MFKKGELIMYPKYGSCKIKRIYDEMVNGSERKYYELVFDDSLAVSIPIDNAEKLGMRYPIDSKELKKILGSSRNHETIEDEVISNLANFSRDKLSTGKTIDTYELVMILRSIAKTKREKNTNLSFGERENLLLAENYLKSEIISVLGEGALKTYKI
jgi:CarD family transcriptional regulator